MNQRREFLKNTGKVSLGLAALTLSQKLSACGLSMSDKGDLGKFGLQLYTLRDELPKDPKDVLKRVSQFGYKQIESYEGKLGMFWGMSNTEFKKYMDDLDMKIVSSHCNIDDNFERKAAEAAQIGMKYLICPWLGPQKSLDDYKRAADKFNKCGEMCKKNDLKFAYHNHDYSFTKLEGQFPQDVLMQNTDKKLVKYEMDIYWVVTAGEDPIGWFKKYPDRFTMCHVKDRAKNSADKQASVVLGQGSIDWASVLKAGKKNGLDYFIVEQEKYDGTTPMDATKTNAEFMKQLELS
jgi:sugar phosphate isomerase/epimerase